MPNDSGNNYIGITIGPIFKTMNFVSSPAALWASSYLFSYISKTICEMLIEKGVNKQDIITPFFDFDLESNDAKLIDAFTKKGVGLFHDRIIFKNSEKKFDVKSIKDIRTEVINKIVDDFALDKKTNPYDFLDNYLLISAAEFEAKNPILASGKILDSLELSAPLCFEENINPILHTFSDAYGDNGSKNDSIKRIIQENLNISNCQLINNGKIKSLSDIANQTASENGKEKLKKYSYYAIVRADADNMSKIISSLKESDIDNNALTFNKFSENCIKYCIDIAKKVEEFGGVTIYAGGDDLLALLPCENQKGETVFDFVKAANGVFKNSFKTYIDKIIADNENKPDDEKKPVPTLSMGIFISYVKFPLYEALDESATLLFKCAKSYKNCVAVKLQKHSGQSAGVIISNEKIDNFLKLQKSILNTNNDDKERFLLSAGQKISLFSTLFDTATGDFIDNVFKNTFDSEYQQSFKESVKSMIEFFKAIDISSMKCIHDDAEKTDSKSAVFEKILRILKFFTEKGGN